MVWPYPCARCLSLWLSTLTFSLSPSPCLSVSPPEPSLPPPSLRSPSLSASPCLCALRGSVGLGCFLRCHIVSWSFLRADTGLLLHSGIHCNYLMSPAGGWLASVQSAAHDSGTRAFRSCRVGSEAPLLPVAVAAVREPDGRGGALRARSPKLCGEL